MPNIKSIPLKTKELQRYKRYAIGTPWIRHRYANGHAMATPMATPWLRHWCTPEIPQSRVVCINIILHTYQVIHLHALMLQSVIFDCFCMAVCTIFLLSGLRIYTGEYKAQGPTLCPTEGRALRGPRALYSPV